MASRLCFKAFEELRGASIPLAWAQDPRRDVILTFKMNGEALPADHGAPLRCLVPGVAGARSVKWVNKLIVASEESQSHWQQNDYKAFNNSTTWETADFSSLPAIQVDPKPHEHKTRHIYMEACIKHH